MRDRLNERADVLARRAEALDAARVAEFGSTGTELAGTGHLRTETARVPRDLVAVGDVLLLGHDLGRDGGTAPALGGGPAGTGPAGPVTVADVFSLYDREGRALPQTAVPGLLDDPSFVREFGDLHRYFQGARLLRLRLVEGKLLAVFRTGERDEDLRVLRWALTTETIASGTIASGTTTSGTTTPGTTSATIAPTATTPAPAVRFLDALGERDHTVPEPYDVEWTVAGRADHVPGRHPHLSLADGTVFVSAVGGALTVKVENDTESGEGVYREPVAEPLQSLADAEVAYAVVGALVLIRVRPYKEPEARHLVFNTLTRAVVRIDAIGRSCRRLPDGQGLVFPGGYCLATGEVRTFDTEAGDGDARAGEGAVPDAAFERSVRSPNGEDVLYVFRARSGGRTLLLPYNLIRKEVSTPVTGHGHALLDDGTLVVLRAVPGEPARVHTVQWWRTPFVSDAYAADHAAGADGGPLARIGNAELVRGLADCLATVRQARAAASGTGTGALHRALLASCERAADRHAWLGDPEAGDLRAALEAVRQAAADVLAESASVRELTARAAESFAAVEEEVRRLVRRVRGEAPARAAEWIDRIALLRRAQGRALALKDLRYADPAAVDALAAETGRHLATTVRRAVDFLSRPAAFAEQHAETERIVAGAPTTGAVAEAEALTARVEERVLGLRTLTEVVTGLGVGDSPTGGAGTDPDGADEGPVVDATVRTVVLERIAEVLGGLNRARALLAARVRELREAEGRAAFTAEFALLGQSVTGALAAAGTPEDCDTQLTSLLVQLDNLEARFADHDGFLTEIADRRAEVRDAFSARRQALQDERARRAERLATSAAQVLASVARRGAGLGSAEEVAAYFASDPLPVKVRGIAERLRRLGDPVRADELTGRLVAARQEALRALRDRTDLYADGGDTVRLGAHRFTVTTRAPELTLVPGAEDTEGEEGEEGAGRLVLALTGTDYRAPVTDPGFAATRPYWGQSLSSENAEVYRAEHLAARLLAEHGADALEALDEAELAALTRRAAQAAYDEGYERGVHDHDAAAVLGAVLRLRRAAGLLRHRAADRAAAQLFWAHGTSPDQRAAWAGEAASLVRARETFGTAPGALDTLRDTLVAASREEGRSPQALTAPAATYLIEQLAASGESFVTGPAARALLDAFARAVSGAAPPGSPPPYAEDVLARLARHDAAGARRLVEGWLTAYAASCGEPVDAGDLAEAVAIEVCPGLARHEHTERTSTGDQLSAGVTTVTVPGLLGTHPRIGPEGLPLRVDEFLARTGDFARRVVPGFRAYQRLRTGLLAREVRRLNLAAYRPRVLSSFVRGRLVDEVYLPLAGDNLARQIGAAGAEGGADRGGLLLLLSPPGYGKTTLVEYVAERLGLLLVKVDGPAIGHEVTSLDPAGAPNEAARRELEKIGFALKAGNNVLLHLDDIQHLSPALLQKFIPLCDATRTLNGHDLRGKRFAVCMTGNPFTESGGVFRVPDMLANRADVWNLGEVLNGRAESFALSFVENALTSHPVLAPLAGRDPADLGVLVRAAAGDPAARADATAHPYAPAERDRVLAVLRLVLRARDTVLAVNAAYIASAGQDDADRTEPPFLLQGSYRDMNRIVARISPAMNEAELDALVHDHYAGEARTLATGAESALLKLAHLRGTATPAQSARWDALCSAYVRRTALGGPEQDPAVRAVAALGLLAERITAVERAIRGDGDRGGADEGPGRGDDGPGPGRHAAGHAPERSSPPE
ncbi:DNA repair ATPase [Streptomyces sp. NPDC049954]|uniref:DNA repair ATPase n=1 Tax=Streptomyces sp. NPDC049954 TaxID=3155779 RepID=UPI00343A81DB